MKHLFEELETAPNEDTRHAQDTNTIHPFVVLMITITYDHHQVPPQEDDACIQRAWDSTE